MSLRAPTKIGDRPGVRAAHTSRIRMQAGRSRIPALLLACAGVCTAAQNAAVQQPLDVLDEVVVAGEHERQRQASPVVLIANPNVVTLSRAGSVAARVQLREPHSEILFQLESTARKLRDNTPSYVQLLPDRMAASHGRKFQYASLELANNINEDDGQPAVFQFGPRASLIDVERLRLRSERTPTVYEARNAIHPETRRCENRFGFGNNTLGSQRRFLLVADGMRACREFLEEREVDLHISDGVPSKLRQELLEIYEPVHSRLASKLGSEPGQVFVAWLSNSKGSDILLERGWVRSSLLLFSGAELQQGLDARQRTELRNLLIREQIERRFLMRAPPSLFVQSAVSYLALLTTAGMDNATEYALAQVLPNWITECARKLDATPAGASPRTMPRECSRLIQFVYDAAIRAKSGGKNTAYSNWRELLTASFKRGETGADAAAFASSSPDALRIAGGLLNGSLNWAVFAAELEKLDVKLRITSSQAGITAQVLSLEHFRDE
jgi:hypothetical protein